MAHKGAIKPHHIEQRFALRLRVLVPVRGFGNQLFDIYRWLDERVGRTGYQIWPDRYAPRAPQSTSIYLDDPALAAELVATFGLIPAPDRNAHAVVDSPPITDPMPSMGGLPAEILRERDRRG